MENRLYTNRFNVTSDNGTPFITMGTSRLGQQHSLSPDGEDFDVAGLENEIRHHPETLQDLFGTSVDTETHPDLKALRNALESLKSVTKETGTSSDLNITRNIR